MASPPLPTAVVDTTVPPATVRQLSAYAELEAICEANLDSLVVVDVFAPWFAPCAPLHMYAKRHLSVVFVSLPVTEMTHWDMVRDQLRATSEPTLVLCTGPSVFDILHGLDGHALTAAVQRFQSMRAMVMTGSLPAIEVMIAPRVPTRSSQSAAVKAAVHAGVGGGKRDTTTTVSATADVVPTAPDPQTHHRLTRRRSSAVEMKLSAVQAKQGAVEMLPK